MCIRSFIILIFVTLQLSIAAAQSGGSFDLSHNVIASGGGSNSAGGTYSVDGTAGQPIAGMQSTNSAFSLRGGFWSHHTLVPTAAAVQVGGRVLTHDGIGIRNVVLTLTNLSTGENRIAISSSFGYYQFDNVTVGNLYSIAVRSKRYSFEPDTRFLNVVDELTDVDFVSNPPQ